MSVDMPSNATVVVEATDQRPPIESAVVSFAGAPGPAILEGSLFHQGFGRYSILACDPIDQFTLPVGAGDCAFRGLADKSEAYPQVSTPEGDLPFSGGWIGYFTYEAGLGLERICCSTRRDVPLPLASFRLYDAAAILDHTTGQWYLAAVDWPVGTVTRRLPASVRLDSLRKRLSAASELELVEPRSPNASDPIANMSPDAYFAKVKRALRYIRAGDIYQVNLTQRFTARADASPLDVYRRLRRLNPSSHAAFLPWGRAAILSSSPELFLSLRGRHVITRPIKGTRPRVGDPALDATYRRELACSEKERAELNMIIDLLRNDLGRVCTPGTMQVTDAGAIERHPTVFHRVATIEGDLDVGRTWLDLLRASFPGGSVTGAPKIRAMQIIDELEPTTRGVYCGSIGHIGLDGSVSLNVAIRTMVQIDDRAYVYAGGAIVADSTPEREYEETIAKAEGMLRALGCGSRRIAHCRLETDDLRECQSSISSRQSPLVNLQ